MILRAAKIMRLVGNCFGDQKHYFGSWEDYVGKQELLGFRMNFADGKFDLPDVKNWGNILFYCCQGYHRR